MSEESQYAISEFNLQKGRANRKPFSSSSKDPEEIIEEYYSEKGYQVERLTYSTVLRKLGDDSIVPKEIHRDVNERVAEKYDTDIHGDLFGWGAFAKFKRTGVPDFLIFREEGGNGPFDYRFVEAKGEGDPLRQSQVRWFTIYSCLPSVITYVESGSEYSAVEIDDSLGE